MATTTNYGWTTPDNTAYVKDGASAIRTLGSSVDTTLFGITGGKNVGLVKITTQTFTSVASQSLNNVFTSAYENYLINFDIFQNTTPANIGFRYRVGGADNSTAAYFYAVTGLNTAPAADNLTAAGQTTGLFTKSFTGQRTVANMNFFNPQIATLTNFTSISAGVSVAGQAASFTGAGLFNANTQFDGITFIASAGTMTGTIRVYGYNN